MRKELIHLIFFTALLGLGEAQAQVWDRAAYWDGDYPFAWGGDGVAMRDALAATGYTVLNADELKTWMDARIADRKLSVVVFCLDIVPETVGETMNTNCTLRKYLDAGGKIVWYADWPLYYVGHADGSRTTWGGGGASAILGFDASSGPNDSMEVVAITPAGAGWGLTQTWQSQRPTSPTITANLTALATISSASAAAWVKHYVAGDKSRGFARLWDTAGTPPVADVMRVAEYLDVKASNPDPPDGAENVTAPLVRWTAGETAAQHDVYFGTNPIPGAAEFRGRQVPAATAYWHGPGLTPGTTYYWRIDEVEADGTTIHTGDVWSFSTTPSIAHNPSPPDGAKYLSTDAELSWDPGFSAFTHDVYFGTDQTEVANGTGATFKGNQAGTLYTPAGLVKDTTYYWRIDEVEADTTTKHEGEVWSFSTHTIPITDPDLIGWWKLDGVSSAMAIDWSGHNHHGTIMGDPEWVAGYDGGALQFDGDGDYVDIGSVGVSGMAPRTVAGWVRASTTAVPAWTSVFGFAHDGGGDGTYFDIEVDDAGHYGVWIEGWGAIMCDVDTRWHHFAGTYDGSSGSWYLDGRLLDSLAGPIATIDEVRIGARLSYHNYFPGLVDDVRIYSKALAQSEIQEIMRGDPKLASDPSPANGSTVDIIKAASLGWSPGETAAQHDVYFGTEKDTVVDADSSSPQFKTRQADIAHSVAGLVEFRGGTYYWRIDEVEPGGTTIHKGRVWSFTVADYLIVDDFEYYDDYCDRIFYKWPDGWGYSGEPDCDVTLYGGNGTGSTVGYLGAPYAEQTIVHSGTQSMPLEYLNDGSTGKALYSETARVFDPPQDWTRYDVKALTLWFRGRLPSVGSFNYDPAGGIYTMTADGADIFGTADEFHYAFKQLSGLGTIEAQVLSVENTDPWAKAGVMIRETPEPNSTFAAVYVTPGNGCRFQGRFVTGEDATSDSDQATAEQKAIKAPYWVKLERGAGNAFNAYYSSNPATDPWHSMVWNPQTITMPTEVYVGLALTSHNTDPMVVCTAELSDVAMAGTVTGQWRARDIGMANNVAEQLYVVVEDSTGRHQRQNHPDPNATVLDTWQEWNIDLAAFGDAGVNLASIKKMYIGLGDRAAPNTGGAGMLYVDDIRLYQLRCLPDLAKPPADFSGNCVVDYLDLQIMASEWLLETGDLQADLDPDHDVDFKDYAGLADTWLDEQFWP